MKTPGMLIMAHIDHLSGEEMGHLVEKLYEQGALSVNLVTTVTKKGRPGFLLLMDATSADEGELSRCLAAGFGISGYHRLSTEHCCEGVYKRMVELVVRVQDRKFVTTIPVKIVGDPDFPLFVRAEDKGVMELCDVLQMEFGQAFSFHEIRSQLASAGQTLRLPLEIDLDLDPDPRIEP